MSFIRRVFDSKNGKWLLGFVLLLQIVVVCYFGIKKTNLFGDEIWTFNLANRYYEPFLSDASPYFNRWLSPGFWNSVVTVSTEHRFAYDSVYYNQAQDVHPPLYYYLIHTICSLFPGQFSKWFGIIPNILLFIGSQLLVFQMGNTITKNRFFSLALVIFYGFSWGIINNTVYIRMYGMLSFWAILAFYLHVKLTDRFSYKTLCLILLTAWLGILTQYYFLVYQFFVSVGFCAYLLWNQKRKELIQYSAGFLFVLILVVAYFPPMIDQIMGKTGNQGQAAFQNLLKSSYVDRINTFSHIVSKDLFGAHIVWVAKGYCMLFLLQGISKIFNIRCKWNRKCIELSANISHNEMAARHEFQSTDFLVLYMLFVSFSYFALISKIAPYFASRYFVIIYPLISFIFVYLLSKLSSLFTQKGFAVVGITCIISFLCAFNTYNKINLFGFNRDLDKVEKVIYEEHKDIAFLVISQGKYWWPAINQTFTMRKTNQSYMLAKDELPQLGNILESYNKTHNKVLVYKTDSLKMDDKKFVDAVKIYGGYNTYKLLDSYIGNIYLFEK